MPERNPTNLPPLEPADIDFRAMQRGDIDVGLQLCRLAGWDQVSRDWEWFISARNTTTSVAFSGATRQVIGTVATIHYGAEFGWVGMLLVHPDAQGRGAGAVLLDHATSQLNDVRSIRLDATPAGRFLYRKHGFTDEFSLTRLEAVTAIASPSSNTRVEPLTDDALPDVIALDRQVFGADRADLLEWMLRGAPEYGFLARHSGRVSGYIFGRNGHAFGHLGPIVAAEASVAVDLTSTCLVQRPGHPFVIDSVSTAVEWVQFLERAGFHEQRPYIRMFRGGGGGLGVLSRQFAILGPEFG